MPDEIVGMFGDLQMTSLVLLLQRAAHIVGMPALVGHLDVSGAI